MAEHATHAQKSDKKKRLAIILIIILLLLIAAGVGGYLLYRALHSAEPVADTPQFAPNASVGALPTKTQEEIEAILNQEINDRTVAYTVNSAPEFENGSAKGNLMLESPANNINYIEFVIRRDDNDDVIYRSGLLKPNQYIAEDTLQTQLSRGTYPCTVDITLYDPETLKEKGMTQAGITITVKH